MPFTDSAMQKESEMAFYIIKTIIYLRVMDNAEEKVLECLWINALID